jgi:HAE1 family hydrophobic/amphiphilic exporter-1
MAVTASTLTTVAVFLPLVFVEGIAGQLFRDQSLTVTFAMLISLVVAMTLIPMLSALKGRPPLGFPEEAPRGRWEPGKRWQKPAAYAGRGIGAMFRYVFFSIAWLVVRLWRAIAAIIGPVMRKASDLAMAPYARAERGYLRVLPAALARPAPVLLVAGVAFALTLAAIPLLGTDLIPQLAQDRFEMTAKLPPGTPLAQTDALVREVQGRHAKDVGVRVLYGVSGTGTRLDASPTESGENIGKLSVVMDDNDAEARLTEALRETMKGSPGAQVDFSRPELFSLSPPLEIEVEGQDLEAIRAAGAKLAGMLRANPHYADVKSSVEQGFPEIQIRFDQDRAAALGLTTRQIADAVVNKVRGSVATRYSFRDRKIDVLVRAQEADRASLEDIRRLIVNPGRGAPVELASVAEVVATSGPSEIHRADQRRVAIVSANLRDIDLGTAIREVESMVAESPLGTDIDMRIGGQGEELGESIRSLLFAFALAVFPGLPGDGLAVRIAAASVRDPVHHPAGAGGRGGGAAGHRSPASVVVFIGLILLVGLVVKNAIILIDKVNQLREAGVAKRQALVEGARSRLRPIMMTTLTAVFGFLPLALAFGEGAEVRSPMAITVIGGLVVSTLLTLVVIPVVYDLLDRKPDEFYAERGRRARKDAEAVAEVLSHEHDPLNGAKA